MRPGRLKIKKGKLFFIIFLLPFVIIIIIFIVSHYARRTAQKNTEVLLAPERTVRLIEGWTINDMDEYLAREGIFVAGGFTEAVGRKVEWCQNQELRIKNQESNCELINSLPEKVDTIEGYLFPDTYRLYLDAEPDDLVEKMLANFQRRISDQSIQKKLQVTSYKLHDAVTMASIVEAEVPHAKDRPVVAGIFWKRLEAGMPLQADSTVNYITGRRARAVTLADTKIDSPYNTYLYPDLPPGPIGNPGLSALLAALAPEESPYWFFLSTEDGTTVFSKTLEEHAVAKRRYLR